MSREATEKPDQREVNKVIRVLSGKQQKYTVHLLMKDGSEMQIQSMHPPKTDWCDKARAVMLMIPMAKEYGSPDFPCARFDDVRLVQVEENEVSS